MEIVIIRHAEAIPVGGEILTDSERPLTEIGFEQCKTVARAFQKHFPSIHLMLASPLLRAQQTAKEIMCGLGKQNDLVITRPELAPRLRRKKLAEYLDGLTGTVALVGHAPSLGELVAWLCGSKKVHIELEKAGVAHVTAVKPIGKGCGTLRLLITPDWGGDWRLASGE